MNAMFPKDYLFVSFKKSCTFAPSFACLDG